jgi:hypothetical protein
MARFPRFFLAGFPKDSSDLPPLICDLIFFCLDGKAKLILSWEAIF